MPHKDKPLTDEELEAFLQMRQAPQTSDLLAARIIHQTADMPQSQPSFAMAGFHNFMRKPAVATAFAACLVVMIGYSLATPTVDMTGWDETPVTTAQVSHNDGAYDEFALMYDMQLSTVLMEDMN